MAESEAQRHGPRVAHRWGTCVLLALILAANVFLKLPNLGHPTLKVMDESFHAVVARNLLDDPFKPTLVRKTYLPYDATDWLNNHVWLHKPVLPLWIIAISYKLLGVSTLALRLPSLILSTLAVLLTYLIGKRLYGAAAGLIAAGIQAIVPVIGMIVHGYVFSDAIDINLLFWSELSLFLMLQTNRKWVWLSGAAAGAAFLSKTFPALFVLAPLGFILVLRTSGLFDEFRTKSGRAGAGSILIGWAVAFLLVAGPWNLYCAAFFPTEFTAEYGLILTHLSRDVENWASPWDRLWFQHLPGALLYFWTIALVGSSLLTFRAVQLKKWEWLFVPVWIVAVLVPFTLATSKTPTATLIAWPALMLGAGFLIARACEGYLVELATAVALLIAADFFTGQFIRIGWGQTAPGEIMRQAPWIAYHIAIGLVVAAVALLKDVRLPRAGQLLGALVIAALIVFPTRWTVLPARGVARFQQPPNVIRPLKNRAMQLPDNAVVFVRGQDARRTNEVMFYVDRTAYALPDDPGEAAKEFKEVRDSGGDVWILDLGPDHAADPLFHPPVQ